MTDTISTRQVLVDDDYDAIYEHAYEQGWTDGLPIVPPTPERVRRLVEASGRPGDEVVAVVPPKRGAATVEKIAINAVMAGCRP
ncbi:MAG: thioredoxin, partial [Chloroflexi bacterium]|nr:thioredoxin [Chloroflexota bacterium]